MAVQSKEGKLSPLLKKWRIKMITPFIFGRVLDFGCGDGELARYIEPTMYYGLDQDNQSIEIARYLHPNHRFVTSISDIDNIFDTIILSAVIEHLINPNETISFLTNFLKKSRQSKIIITTPHPRSEKIHTLGASFGLFSKHAAEEHHTLFTYETLSLLSPQNFKMSLYKTFQFGFNQLAIYNYV